MLHHLLPYTRRHARSSLSLSLPLSQTGSLVPAITPASHLASLLATPRSTRRYPHSKSNPDRQSIYMTLYMINATLNALAVNEPSVNIEYLNSTCR